MIQSRKIVVDKQNVNANHFTEKKYPCASVRGPHSQEHLQMGGSHEKRDLASFKNDINGNNSTGYPSNSWARNSSADSNSNLSYEEMYELKRIIDKRVKNKISEGLSAEGRKAMELARVELEYSKRKGNNSAINNNHTLPELSNSKKRGKMKKKISFVDAYEGSSASRLSGDIMDENSSDGNPKRWALGGGNINVAMETVEIVSYGETQSDSDADDIAIEETAKLNSVEKCLVWMDVHSDIDYDEQR